MLPESTLTKSQRREFTTELEDGTVIVANVRHDDECGNGHNTFAITADVYDLTRNPGGETHRINSKGKRRYLGSCGCQHGLIAEHFHDLAGMIRWHLFGTDGPLHYMANAMYWAGHCGWCNGGANDPPNIEHLKSTIAYGALPDVDVDIETFWTDKDALSEFLKNRLDRLMLEFKAAVESLGMTY